MLGAEPFLRLEVEVTAPITVGDLGAGVRRYVPIVGGTVTGELAGKVLPGADWQTIRADGALELSARYAFQTEDGAVVEILSEGLRAGPPEILERLGRGEMVDPQLYYFRTAVRFRTGAPQLFHLNSLLGVARGERRASVVALEVFKVL